MRIFDTFRPTDGSTLDTRKAASAQIASILQSHPAQFPSITRQIALHLRSRDWEARIAASYCLGLIAEHFQHHTPQSLLDACRQPMGFPCASSTATQQRPSQGMLSFTTFDIFTVLKQGRSLLSSGGEEYDTGPQDPAVSRSVALAQQRAHLKSRLGLGGPMETLVDTSDMFHDEDFIILPEMKSNVGNDCVQIAASEVLANIPGGSARERAAALRRAKSLKRGGSTAAVAPPAKKAKSESEGINIVDNEMEWKEILTGRWPFQTLCDTLLLSILDQQWEIRHGAALALREILRFQASAAGVISPVVGVPSGWAIPGGRGVLSLGAVSATDVTSAQEMNTMWIEDACIHMLCVLGLDRFSDFLSDKVIAPVRETIAQALGTVCRSLPSDSIPPLVSTLKHLAQGDHGLWVVRLGGLLGLKYVLAALPDDINTALVLDLVLPSVIAGLQDKDDDVQAVAADALLPVSAIVALDQSEPAGHTKSLLWDLLLDMSDLSPATGSVMTLLASMAQAASVDEDILLSFISSDKVARLWPYFRHTLRSVREAVVKCLGALLLKVPLKNLLDGEDFLCAGRLLFQNILMEEDESISQESYKAWQLLMKRSSSEEEGLLEESFTPNVVTAMLCLASTPANTALDLKKLTLCGKANQMKQLVQGVQMSGDGNRMARMRMLAASALASVPAETLLPVLVQEGLESATGTCRLVAALTLGGHVVAQTLTDNRCSSLAQHALNRCLDLLMIPDPVLFSELESILRQIQRQAIVLMERAESAGISITVPTTPVESLNADGALALAQQLPVLAPGVDPQLLTARAALCQNALLLKTSDALLRTTVNAAMASAVVHGFEMLPAKLNCLIQPLVASVRREPNACLQDSAASALALLTIKCADRTPTPGDKIISNMITFACGDSSVVPNPEQPPDLMKEIDEQQQPVKSSRKGSLAAPESAEDPAGQALALAARGGEATLRSIVELCGVDIANKVPKLWQRIVHPLAFVLQQAELSMECLKSVVQALHVLGAITPALPQADDLMGVIGPLLPALAMSLKHKNSAVKVAAAECLGKLAEEHTVTVVPSILQTLLPLLSAGEAENSRLGGLLAVDSLISRLKTAIVPYSLLVIVPLMGRMSDPLPSVRAMASKAFASVVALLPLAQGSPVPPGLSAEQTGTLEREHAFLSQLLDGASKAENYKPPVELKGGASLRAYQQEGINWLAFLKRFGLHGVLADDMGLGKTLQSTMIMAAATAEARAAFKESGLTAYYPHPHLIVCPSTLVSHWPHEIEKFVDTSALKALRYGGTLPQRAEQQGTVRDYDVVVMSYEVLRSDIHWVEKQNWLYCILDEGHAIRNPNSAVSKAAKRVKAQHRLVLSGTPIMNSVLELWAIFDFLMPGFLGTHRAFNSKFGKALAEARGAAGAGKKTAKTVKAAESGLLALEGLHRQVMPFILRRTKDQVLKDLPPKIIQDILCEPSALQKVLYEEFSNSQVLKEIEGEATAAPHVFQALQYLRKLCSHPALVLDMDVPQHVKALHRVHAHSIHEIMKDISHAPKLGALRELLVDAGIAKDVDAVEEEEDDADVLEAVESCGHRVLIFAQLKSFLDIVEETVLRPLGISHLRLDGSVPPADRFSRVQEFNSDPTIGAMLLTTAVGGLGLNLTAADTVIFLEHDWNPMQDLQAMDRAHRLGQKRTVNVYRLLMAGTLEERVMSLQRFKLDVAAAVVNTDNVSLAAMETENILDLFAVSDNDKEKKEQESKKKKKGDQGGLAALLESLGDVAKAEEQYAEEFDLGAFKKKLQ